MPCCRARLHDLAEAVGEGADCGQFLGQGEGDFAQRAVGELGGADKHLVAAEGDAPGIAAGTARQLAPWCRGRGVRRQRRQDQERGEGGAHRRVRRRVGKRQRRAPGQRGGQGLFGGQPARGEETHRGAGEPAGGVQPVEPRCDATRLGAQQRVDPPRLAGQDRAQWRRRVVQAPDCRDRHVAAGLAVISQARGGQQPVKIGQAQDRRGRKGPGCGRPRRRRCGLAQGRVVEPEARLVEGGEVQRHRIRPAGPEPRIRRETPLHQQEPRGVRDVRRQAGEPGLGGIAQTGASAAGDDGRQRVGRRVVPQGGQLDGAGRGVGLGRGQGAAGAHSAPRGMSGGARSRASGTALGRGHARPYRRISVQASNMWGPGGRQPQNACGKPRRHGPAAARLYRPGMKSALACSPGSRAIPSAATRWGNVYYEDPPAPARAFAAGDG